MPDLASHVGDLLQALSEFEQSRDTAPASAWRSIWPRLAPDFDPAITLWVAVLAGTATFLAAWIGHALAWPLAELMALGVCIFAMVLGSLPKPQIVAPIMARGVFAGVIASMVYRFGPQPWVETLPGLVLSIAPFILLGSLARAGSRFGAPALDANMCFLLASQAGTPVAASPADILGGGVALVVAVAVVACAVVLLPSPGSFRARNAAQAIARDIARIAGGRRSATALETAQRSSRQVMRLALHLGQGTELEASDGGSLIAVLEAGTALGRLQILRGDTGLVPGEAAAIDRAMAAVARMGGAVEPAAAAIEAEAQIIAAGDVFACLQDLAASLRDGRKILSPDEMLTAR